ncbi:hypothetical protein J437_LFUL002886 [Ladona fulva]|uniref:Transposase n=1 Tax=Ladona fulva TaxID=123851 RepID=A0A8K0PCH1_LADFU|nr:hypothetical protein J437_LFUL002886 [Ladona fulva]
METRAYEVDDEPRSGRPSLSDKVKDQFESAIREDRRLTLQELEGRFQMSKSTVQRLLNILGYHKLCARWVPKILTGSQTEQVAHDTKEDQFGWEVLTHPPTAQSW